jgi:hypothetical protein
MRTCGNHLVEHGKIASFMVALHKAEEKMVTISVQSDNACY